MIRYTVQAVVLGMVVCWLAVPVAEGEEDGSVVADWPQWRGPNRDGQVGGEKWPARLERSSLRELWRRALGPSYSGPIVTEALVFTTETRDKESEVVLALDRKTGEERWRAEWEGAMTVPFFAWSNGSWIRSTPAYDGECLYVAGMRDVLVCLHAETGREKWRVDFVDQLGTPLPAFGFVCSPLVDGSAVYVQAGASVVKLDKGSGRSSGGPWMTVEVCGDRRFLRRLLPRWVGSDS